MAVTGTIFDIKQFAIHDGPGIRTTVFFKGCPLDCRWCHNPESRKPEPEPVTSGRLRTFMVDANSDRRTIGCTVSSETVLKEILRDEIFFDESGGGVTFSGGEPMMQIEFLDDLLRRCRRHGLHTTVDTCGCAPWQDFDRVHGAVDLFLFDLKLMDDRLHREYTGSSNALLHDNLIKLAEIGAEIVVRIPMITGITDTESNLDAIADFLQPWPSLRRIDLLPYNKLGEDKTRRYGLERRRLTVPSQPRETLESAARRFAARGFDVKVGG